MMDNLETIFLDQIKNLDFDLRKENNDRWSKKGRWFDQKVVPSIVAFISECILQLDDDKINSFSGKDIENSNFFQYELENFFGKPPAEKTPREVDKFIGQPLRVLSATKLLNADHSSIPYVYSIKEKKVLEKLTESPRNTHLFLTIYIEKVLKDSGFYNEIEIFFDEVKKGNLEHSVYKNLLNKYKDFIKSETDIQKELEPARIFPKVLNHIALKRNLYGSQRGGVSKYPISMNLLMYSADNPQDSGKDKRISRAEYRLEVPVTSKTQITKAKDDVKKYHNYTTEVTEGNEINVRATQGAHILSEKDYPEFSMYRENIITLTPNQHFLESHPNNNTRVTDANFQKKCLLYKLKSIKKSYEIIDYFYDINSFIMIVNTLYENILNEPIKFNEDISTIEKIIESIDIAK